MITPYEIARMTDISAVNAQNDKKEIDYIIGVAKRYRFISVYALPAWTGYVREQLSDTPDVLTGGPVGFPSGGHHIEVKKAEARQLIKDGVQEMDLVMNIGKFKSGDYLYVLDEIRRIDDIAGDSIPLKVIIEIPYLTDDEIKKACELCINGGADFVKTGTGWAGSGSDISKLRLIKDFVDNRIKVKVAGGIRSLEAVNEMRELGVDRFGISSVSAIEIIEKSFDFMTR